MVKEKISFFRERMVYRKMNDSTKGAMEQRTPHSKEIGLWFAKRKKVCLRKEKKKGGVTKY
jgi:hypothetical protein